MKKIICMALALVMVLAITITSAFATTEYRVNFSINAQCVNETGVSYHDPYELITTLYGRIYLYHTANPNPATYTNMFHIVKEYRYAIGQKFCTQGLYVPIETNLVVPGMLVGISGRGNTKYNQNYGLTSITLSGYYGNY